jgi:hypothetical protein
MKKKLDKTEEIEKALADYKVELEKKFGDDTKVVEEAGGLDTLLNKVVLLLCAGYFYEGKLTGVNTSFVQLTNASIVYNPANFSKESLRGCTRDKLPSKVWYVERQSIESYGELE